MQKTMKSRLRALSIVMAAGVLGMEPIEAQTNSTGTAGVVEPLETVDILTLPAPAARKDVKVFPAPLPQFLDQDKPLPSTPANESVPQVDQPDSSEPVYPDGE
ncbi:MAG: hypothetical protein H7Y22_02855 [Gemmatimonadaceae bacterium]|nr:hypothetical protein [Gloeobacterales cyanobacterium ES-bin-141]